MSLLSQHKKLALTTIAGLVLCANAYANTDNVRIAGTISGYVVPSQSTAQTVNSTSGKPIVYEKIVLSSAAKQWLATHSTESAKLSATQTSTLPAQISLGMNNVPVLDQGRHGTCVTFAVSGALDAIHGKTDYVSQLCNLELGAFLATQDSSYPSGWEGSWGDIVLNQINTYGVISIDSQHTLGCARVFEYPVNDEYDTGKIMPAPKFTKRSDKIMDNITFKTLMNHDIAFTNDADKEKVLTEVKEALNNGHRVLIGTLLDVDVGHNGALGTYKVSNDTWMLTPRISKDAKNGTIEAGHEMIITGYDDNAEVMGPHHTKQVGVLTLRNSWGDDAGDHGNYYMTYAHFTTLAMEINELIPSAKTQTASK